MQTLEVTDEQHATIQRLRESIGEHVVGEYGHVRERDVVQFLIDNLTGELEASKRIEPDADDVAAVGAAVETVSEPDSRAAVSYDEDAAIEAAEEAADEREESDTGGSRRDRATSDGEIVAGDETPDSATHERSTDASDVEGADGATADDDELLDEMMRLLETYDEKWTESTSPDSRYTVTLPDGSTTEVQTKDDVRALLFKNYR